MSFKAKFFVFVALVVVVFVSGAVLGGGWKLGAAEEVERKQLDQIEQCLPLEDAEALQACTQSDEGGQ